MYVRIVGCTNLCDVTILLRHLKTYLGVTKYKRIFRSCLFQHLTNRITLCSKIHWVSNFRLIAHSILIWVAVNHSIAHNTFVVINSAKKEEWFSSQVSCRQLSIHWLHTGKRLPPPHHHDPYHLTRFFSAFWSSSRWPMSSRRQKLLARVHWYPQSSLKHITELITVIELNLLWRWSLQTGFTVSTFVYKEDGKIRVHILYAHRVNSDITVLMPWELLESLDNLTGVSATLRPVYLPKSRAIAQSWYTNNNTQQDQYIMNETLTIFPFVTRQIQVQWLGNIPMLVNQ